jgi:hypothetical protein
MFEVDINEVVPTRLGGGQAAIIGVLRSGTVTQGEARIVGSDGGAADVVVLLIMFGMHPIRPGTRVEPGDQLGLVVDRPAEDIAWAVGGTLRSASAR